MEFDLTYLLVVLAPILVAGFKKLTTLMKIKVSSKLYPYVCVAIGVLLVAGANWLADAKLNPAWMAIVGPLGIGARELLTNGLKLLGLQSEKSVILETPTTTSSGIGSKPDLTFTVSEKSGVAHTAEAAPVKATVVDNENTVGQTRTDVAGILLNTTKTGPKHSKPVDLIYRWKKANAADIMIDPVDQMKKDGIIYQAEIRNHIWGYSTGDENVCLFFCCENVPLELPNHLELVELDPMEFVNRGITRSKAKYLVSYKQENS